MHILNKKISVESTHITMQQKNPCAADYILCLMSLFAVNIMNVSANSTGSRLLMPGGFSKSPVDSSVKTKRIGKDQDCPGWYEKWPTISLAIHIMSEAWVKFMIEEHILRFPAVQNMSHQDAVCFCWGNRLWDKEKQTVHLRLNDRYFFHISSSITNSRHHLKIRLFFRGRLSFVHVILQRKIILCPHSCQSWLYSG